MDEKVVLKEIACCLHASNEFSQGSKTRDIFVTSFKLTSTFVVGRVTVLRYTRMISFANFTTASMDTFKL